MTTVGIIGGTGLYNLEGLTSVREIKVDTPFGEPSDILIAGELDGVRLVFIPRHGRGHRLLPSEVPYAANVFALKSLGAEWLISVSAVGSMQEDIHPGSMVVPTQYLDRTRGTRRSTFFGDGVVAHVSLADPVCPSLGTYLASVVTARVFASPGTPSISTWLLQRSPISRRSIMCSCPMMTFSISLLTRASTWDSFSTFSPIFFTSILMRPDLAF